MQGSSGETDIENTPMDMLGGEMKETVRCMERVTWKLTIPCIKWIANGNLLYDSGNSNKVSITTSGVGWGGRWEGSLRGRERMYTYG